MKKHLFLIILLLLPFSVFATEIYFESSSTTYNAKDIFLVNVLLDSKEEYINALDVVIEYPEDILNVQELSNGNSILNLWVREPMAENGLISFSGGIPGGYFGKEGLLLRIAFKVNSLVAFDTYATLNILNETRVFLNDGNGTEGDLIKKPITILLKKEIGQSKNEWLREVIDDRRAPDNFDIFVQRDSSLFENQYYIIFSTTDKQSGIDYYEVKEGDREWEKAESPYLLLNQNLKEMIKVRAVDKAGNQRIIQKDPSNVRGLIIFLLLILMIIVFLVIRRIKKQ